jgi:hypothetical protein
MITETISGINFRFKADDISNFDKIACIANYFVGIKFGDEILPMHYRLSEVIPLPIAVHCDNLCLRTNVAGQCLYTKYMNVV